MRSSCEVLLTTTLLGAVVAVLACSDAPAAPSTIAQADSTRLASMTTRELLLAVLDRLDTLEARFEREAAAARARLDGLVAGGGGIALAKQGKADLFAEVSVCGAKEVAASGKMESSLSLWGGGEGQVGVDAYGNGATGEIRAFATQDVKVIPGGSASLAVEVCVKGSGGFGASGNIPAGAAETLLRNALAAVPANQLAAVATGFGMEGTSIGGALDAIASFTLADLRFGRGSTAPLLDALPLPSDLANLLRNPEGILDRAAEAGQFAVDKLCAQTLFTGEFAQRASRACDLRDQVPSAAELIDILRGLDGLPGSVSALESDLSSACSRINAMRSARVDIDPAVVNFPLGIGDVTTFPGYNQAVFLGIAAAC